MAMASSTSSALADEFEVPDSIEITFAEDVPQFTRDQVELGVEAFWRVFGSLFDVDDPLRATVLVFEDLDAAAAAWARNTGTSIGTARSLLTGRHGAPRSRAIGTLAVLLLPQGRSQAFQTTIHELAHMAQNWARGGQGPVWLGEGPASYYASLANATVAPSPRLTLERRRELWSDTKGLCRAGVMAADQCSWVEAPLTAIDGRRPFDDAAQNAGRLGAYGFAELAFSYLVHLEGADSYLCFLDRQSQGSAWRAAFEACFGITVTDFYSRFARFQQDHYMLLIPNPRQRLV